MRHIPRLSYSSDAIVIFAYWMQIGLNAFKCIIYCTAVFTLQRWGSTELILVIAIKKCACVFMTAAKRIWCDISFTKEVNYKNVFLDMLI